MIVPKTRKSFRKFPYNLMKGSLLEAKDAYNTWYPVKVLSIKDEKVHVHFCNWSTRYDTWYPLISNCLRPLVVTNSRDNSDSKASLCAPRTDRNHRDTSQYDQGTFVMAVWRNDYEYLAEVLAHRQRQGDRSEYRLRYIWDNVVEWTPVTRLRKASQYEIDFVLQFCRQHGSSHSETLTSNGNNVHSPKTEYTSNGPPKNSPHLTTRSNIKQAEPLGETSNNTSKSSKIHTTKTPKTGVEPKLEMSFDQNDMVYDKSVLQFHEACRKRRELKRQAAMTLNDLDNSVSTHPHVDSIKTEVSAHTPSLNSSTTSSVYNSGSKKRKLSNGISDCYSVEIDQSPNHLKNSPDCEVKPPLAKRRQELPTSTSVMEPPTSTKLSSVLALSQSTEVQRSSTTTGTADKEKPGNLVLRISKQQCVSPKSRNSLVVKVSRSSLSNTPKTDADNDVKSSISSSAEPSNVTVAPIVYPCPYCPRRLRRAKLLTAHIANYHKAEAESMANRNDVIQCDENSRQLQSTHGDRSPQQSRYHPSLDDRLSSTDSKIQRLLLACHRCGICNPVSNNETESLMQCQSCLCWVHKTCYCPLLDEGVMQCFNCCDGCLRTSERVRTSRRNECHLSWKLHNRHDTGVNKSSQCLIANATELLDWTHRFAPVLKTGWTLLNKTKLPSPTATKITPASMAIIEKLEKKQSIQSSALDGLSDFSTDRDSPIKRVVNNQIPLESYGNDVVDTQSTTENADGKSPRPSPIRIYGFSLLLPGFFMEFKNAPSMEPILPFPAHADSDCMPTRSTTTRVPLSTVANSVEPGYWRVIEEADGEDETIVSDSNDALTGFLQDLGPNVLPDLDSMVDYLMPSNVDPSCSRPTTLLNGHDDDDILSSVVQPHVVASILDTPIKEALRSANLLAPVPVALVSSVLQTADDADDEGKSAVIYQHPTTTDNRVLSTSSPEGQTDFLRDSLRPVQDTTNVVSSETVSGEQFSSSTDLLTIVPFRDPLEEAVPFHSMATVVSCSEKSLIDESCYASQKALSTSSDCDHSPMGNLQVSEMDWISAPVPSVCTTNNTVSISTFVGCPPSRAPSYSVTTEPVIAGGKQTVEPTSCLVTDEQFEFLPIEARGRTATTVRQGGYQEDDYLDHRGVLANNKVNQNLDHLDQFILSPLERAITVVEAQLEQINTQLFVTRVEEGSSENHFS